MEQGLEGAPWEVGGLARVIRLLCSVPVSQSPSSAPGSLFLPVNQNTDLTGENAATQKAADVLILISNFTPPSSLSYWWFCPCAGAALEAECCCVSEGTASLGSCCASSTLQQKSVHKPEWLPPKNNKIGNTALSTEPEWEDGVCSCQGFVAKHWEHRWHHMCPPQWQLLAGAARSCDY